MAWIILLSNIVVAMPCSFRKDSVCVKERFPKSEPQPVGKVLETNGSSVVFIE